MLKRSANDYATLSDSELASRIAAKDVAAVRLVTGRNNQRLFRTASDHFSGGGSLLTKDSNFELQRRSPAAKGPETLHWTSPVKEALVVGTNETD